MRDTGWFKSTFSSPASDNCVEVRITEVAARVRDSKNPAGGHLVLGRAAFAVLVAGVAR
jgi:uncharacterized protein DUF397